MIPQTPVVILQARILFMILLLAMLLATGAIAQNNARQLTIGDNGLLVVTAAQDTSYGYNWVDGPGAGRRSLYWASGTVSIPVDYPVEGFGAFDLAIACTGDFGGVGDAGRMIMADGQYKISDPILLTDGTVYFFADAGLLEVVASRVRYFPPELKESSDPRAGFVLLVGLALLIAVLIRRSRKIIKKRADTS